MSEVIIKKKWKYPVNYDNEYDIIYRDNVITIEGDYNGSYFIAKFNKNKVERKIVVSKGLPKIIVNKAIAELKKIKPIDKYIPTLMRLVALKETL